MTSESQDNNAEPTNRGFSINETNYAIDTHTSLKNAFDKNLAFLAKQLALNYFHTSIPSSDIKQNEYFVFKEDNINKQFGLNCLKYLESGSETNRTQLVKNVLIIGAGASFNAFKNLPLAEQATQIIYNNYNLGDLVYKASNGKEAKFAVSFGYLADLFIYGWENKESSEIRRDKYANLDKVKINSKVDKLIKPAKDIKPKKGTMAYFLFCIGQKFARDYKKIKYRAGLSDLTFEELDFEQSLYLLSQVFSGDQVREDLETLYNKRYGHSLFYSLVAVLFRQRAIDVVINFNFDELLDQAIEDEIGENRYIKIVSEGDCLDYKDYCTKVKIGKVEYEKLVSPLYIKPHGTWSDKASMRFTKDHYDDIPGDIEHLLLSLFQDYIDKQKNPETSKLKYGNVTQNIVLVGFDMGSLELDRILRKANPRNLNIFSFVHVNADDYSKRYRETCDKYLSILKSNYINDNTKHLGIYLIPNIIVSDQDPNVIAFNQHNSLADIFNDLFVKFRGFFRSEFQPVDIPKYRLTNSIFGDPEFLKIATEIEIQSTADSKDKKSEQKLNPKDYPSNYFDTYNYFLDKTLFELTIKLQRSH